MKILMVDSLVGNDYTIWLCRGLARTGHDIQLVTIADRSDLHDEPFTVLAKSPSKSKSISKFIKLWQYVYYLGWLMIYILRSQPNIVHFQFFRRPRIESLYFPLIKLITSHLVYTAHNILPHDHNVFDYYLRYPVYKSASTIIVHTEKIKTDLQQTYQLDVDKIQVIPAVKPVSGTRDDSINQQLAREKLGIGDDAKVLLFFGYIREYKGLDLLLESFDKARSTINNLILVVAGKPHSTDLLRRYEQKIKMMAYSDSVMFYPEYIPKDEVDYYFKASDAIALPYKHIDFSGILQEAFAYKKPVLATDVGNFADFIVNGKNGYIAAEQNREAFATIIENAFADDQQLAQMGEHAFEMDKAYPDWQQIGKLTSEMYLQIYEKDFP